MMVACDVCFWQWSKLKTGRDQRPLHMTLNAGIMSLLLAALADIDPCVWDLWVILIERCRCQREVLMLGLHQSTTRRHSVLVQAMAASSR